MAPTAKAHHYAVDAASLLETCLARLREAINLDTQNRYKALFDMEEALVNTERLLLGYVVQLIDLERETEEKDDHEDTLPQTLSESIVRLETVLQAKKQKQLQAFLMCRAGRSKVRSCTQTQKKEKDFNVLFAVDLAPPGHNNEVTSQSMQSAGDCSSGFTTFDQTRSATDSLLFRLIVALQLCLLRIDDARFVITGRRFRQDTNLVGTFSWSPIKFGFASSVCVLGMGSMWLFRSKLKVHLLEPRGMLRLTGEVALAAFAGKLVAREWGNLWMTSKILKSTAAIEEWQEQWLYVQTGGPESKSQRLIQYALSQSPKSSLWHSEGEMRFLLLKRAMDLYYASVGTAVEATKDTQAAKTGKMIWQLPIAAAAAASYYSLVGPNRRASRAVASSSLGLIQYAWGMVSLPAIKQLSLKASRLLKGAAIAERVTIAGVPCFVLSRDPIPDLSAALVRGQRRRRRSLETRLSTIQESGSEQDAGPSLVSKLPRRPPHAKKKGVILHLTGGGFFAHTIASDCPFLLDWSNSTNAVVICPEYALLPENTFPTALEQVVHVHCSLVSGACDQELGIAVDRVVVTGESAGGNLAASLCVKLCLDNTVDFDSLVASKQGRDDIATGHGSPVGESPNEPDLTRANVRLPDAIMLSCPALNLTLDLSPSRVVGNQDPVLPSGLISAISDAYIPAALGVNKRHPLVSPFYAPDDVLRVFPPTLIFAGSDDPLFDDSVDFIARLRSLGVESELRAASHLPHAYWGLGTAGFPEAQQVQHECEEWLVRQFTK